MKIKNIESYLKRISKDELIIYCRDNLTGSQKKLILSSKKRKPNKFYIYDIGGELLHTVSTMKEVADYIKCPYQTANIAFKRKNIIYGIYWISLSPEFDCEKTYYNVKVSSTINL
jgi:hypothetical protein